MAWLKYFLLQPTYKQWTSGTQKIKAANAPYQIKIRSIGYATFCKTFVGSTAKNISSKRDSIKPHLLSPIFIGAVDDL
jgi:hypothetical protein